MENTYFYFYFDYTKKYEELFEKYLWEIFNMDSPHKRWYIINKKVKEINDKSFSKLELLHQNYSSMFVQDRNLWGVRWLLPLKSKDFLTKGFSVIL